MPKAAANKYQSCLSSSLATAAAAASDPSQLQTSSTHTQAKTDWVCVVCTDCLRYRHGFDGFMAV